MSRFTFAAAYLAIVAVVIVASAATQAAGPVLYGVTGEGSMNPETLYRIDTAAGATARIAALGNGGDGEEIAFDPTSGRLLHASGRVIGDDLILEWVSPSTGTVTPITAKGDECDEVSGLTYMSNGTFLAGTVDQLLCTISSDGAIKKVAELKAADIATGLAYVDGKLYATIWGNRGQLVTIDPVTGAVTSEVKLQLEGDYRFTALATNPCTGELYAAMAVGSTEIRTPTSRSLVKIDPSSGKVTVVRDLGLSVAGLAFAADDCKTDASRAAAAGAVSNLQVIEAQSTQANLERAAGTAAAPASAPASVVPTTAAQPAPALTVRPPNTGDGGLLR
jgi:hypothetical protein